MLTVDDVRNATAEAGKSKELSDGNGLVLRVRGKRKSWYYRTQKDGKRTAVHLGDYPNLNLMKARALVKAMRHDEAVQSQESNPQLAHAVATVDAMERRKQALKAEPVEEESAMTFKDCGDDWFAFKSGSKVYAAKHLATITYRLNHYIYPVIGNMPLNRITKRDFASLIVGISKNGRFETAKRVAGIVKEVYEYAMTRGYVETTPALSTHSILPRGIVKKNFAHTVDQRQIGLLMNALYKIQSPRTKTALLLIAYCATRVGETLAATWSEFDFDKALWTIPAQHTKRRRVLCVPLAHQVVKLLRDYKATLSGGSCRGDAKVFTQHEAALLNKLNDITNASDGELPKLTIHGFRHTASTILHGLHFDTLWIEHQLSHRDRDTVRGTYNHFEYLDERRNMMQTYADWLDEQAAQVAQTSTGDLTLSESPSSAASA